MSLLGSPSRPLSGRVRELAAASRVRVERSAVAQLLSDPDSPKRSSAPRVAAAADADRAPGLEWSSFTAGPLASGVGETLVPLPAPKPAWALRIALATSSLQSAALACAATGIGRQLVDDSILDDVLVGSPLALRTGRLRTIVRLAAESGRQPSAPTTTESADQQLFEAVSGFLALDDRLSFDALGKEALSGRFLLRQACAKQRTAVLAQLPPDEWPTAGAVFDMLHLRAQERAISVTAVAISMALPRWRAARVASAAAALIAMFISVPALLLPREAWPAPSLRKFLAQALPEGLSPVPGITTSSDPATLVAREIARVSLHELAARAAAASAHGAVKNTAHASEKLTTGESSEPFATAAEPAGTSSAKSLVGKQFRLLVGRSPAALARELYRTAPKTVIKPYVLGAIREDTPEKLLVHGVTEGDVAQALLKRGTMPVSKDASFATVWSALRAGLAPYFTLA